MKRKVKAISRIARIKMSNLPDDDIRFSQHKIEKYLDENFTEPGTFLEIGCWNGEIISQTLYLEREKGWTGLCVDPFPSNFEQRQCKLCQKAVSLDGLPRAFIKVSIDRRYGGDVSYFSGFKDRLAAHWPLIVEFCDYEEVQVETITFTQLCADYAMPKHIEFLSVDVEGAELEIFKSIDFSQYSFGLIVFEHNEDPMVREQVGEILCRNGYALLASLRVDDIYYRPSADSNCNKSEL
jgi:FkbM family methyltransferase